MLGQELAPRRFAPDAAVTDAGLKPVAVASSGLFPQPLSMIQGRFGLPAEPGYSVVSMTIYDKEGPGKAPRAESGRGEGGHFSGSPAVRVCCKEMTLLTTPQVRIVASEEFGAAGAAEVAAALKKKPDAVLGLPTGNTPVPVYQALLARRDLDFSRARVAMLDEYLGAGDRPISFYRWLRSHILDGTGIPPERILRMPSDPNGIAAACAAYDRQLAAWGGCDLQMLGLGLTGHIGFNEPGSAGDSVTRTVPLSAVTRDANEEYWQGEEVPDTGVTTGIGVILRARRIVLLVSGERKAATLRRALEGPIGSDCPASFLRWHPEVLVLADQVAASGL